MSGGDTRYAKVPRPPGASRYGWFIGVVLLLALALITLNTATSRHVSSKGLVRAKAFTWSESARLHAQAYREAVA